GGGGAGAHGPRASDGPPDGAGLTGCGWPAGGAPPPAGGPSPGRPPTAWTAAWAAPPTAPTAAPARPPWSTSAALLAAAGLRAFRLVDRAFLGADAGLRAEGLADVVLRAAPDLPLAAPDLPLAAPDLALADAPARPPDAFDFLAADVLRAVPAFARAADEDDFFFALLPFALLLALLFATIVAPFPESGGGPNSRCFSAASLRAAAARVARTSAASAFRAAPTPGRWANGCQANST